MANTAPAESGPLSNVPCRYHFTTGCCPDGDSCLYLHDKYSDEAAWRYARRSRSSVKNFPVFRVPEPLKAVTSNSSSSSDPEADDGKCCLICFEMLGGDRSVTVLPCIHRFHADCVFPWVKEKGTCPKCLFSVVRCRKKDDPSMDSLSSFESGSITRCSSPPHCSSSRPNRGNRSHLQPTTRPTISGRWIMHPAVLVSGTHPKGINRISEYLFGPRVAVAWVPNSASSACMLCNRSWSLFNRRHHCRVCGILTCGSCSSNQSLKGYTFGQKCCRECTDRYKSDLKIIPPWSMT